MTMPSESNCRLYVKSYFVASVEDAMATAHAELGPDALLLNSREAPPEARHLGEYEVVFGVRPSTQSGSPAPTAIDPVEDLQRRMEELRELVCNIRPAAEREPAGQAWIEEALHKAGVSRVLAREIDCAVHQRLRGQGVIPIGRPKGMPGWDAGVMLPETAAELGERFEVDATIGRIAALVGPPGAGKTSALVKLAITQGLAARRAVRLISIDHYRIAAADQLRTYAAILGVPFTLAETPAALVQAIDSAPADALVLIDTPGYSAAALEGSGGDLANFLRVRQDIDTQLVLTASMHPAALQRTADLYQRFGPAKLLFTRLDEAGSTGSAFCESARLGKPLSFFSSGQLIPEDLEPANKERIVAELVHELPQVLEAVA